MRKTLFTDANGFLYLDEYKNIKSGTGANSLNMRIIHEIYLFRNTFFTDSSGMPYFEDTFNYQKKATAIVSRLLEKFSDELIDVLDRSFKYDRDNRLIEINITFKTIYNSEIRVPIRGVSSNV